MKWSSFQIQMFRCNKTVLTFVHWKTPFSSTTHCSSKATPVAHIYARCFPFSVIQRVFLIIQSLSWRKEQNVPKRWLFRFACKLTCFYPLHQILVCLHCSWFVKINKWCSWMHSPLWFNKKEEGNHSIASEQVSTERLGHLRTRCSLFCSSDVSVVCFYSFRYIHAFYCIILVAFLLIFICIICSGFAFYLFILITCEALSSWID